MTTVSPATEKKLRDAMERLLAGKSKRTDGRLTKANLHIEAGVSRATMNRATEVIADWNASVGAPGPSARGRAVAVFSQVDLQTFVIGGRNRQIENARFVPPPPAETEEAMAALERYINREDRHGIPPIIDAGLMHYQFETIHPFADGNGRVGRILIPIFLMQEKVLENPLLYLSPAVEGRKDDYVDLMLGVSRSGNWTEWLLFFLEMVIRSCQSASATLVALQKLRDDFHQKIKEDRSSTRFMTIVDELFVTPVISIPQVVKKLSVTYPAAKYAVDRLRALNVGQHIEEDVAVLQ